MNWRIAVSSASGANGSGYGAVLAFSMAGETLERFGEQAGIVDPRGLRVSPDGSRLYVNNGDNRVLAMSHDGKIIEQSPPIADLNPGGGNFNLAGHYHVGMRTARTIAGFPGGLTAPPVHVLPDAVVPFPRGFAFGADGRLFLASGIGPNGEGENIILAFGTDMAPSVGAFVRDERLSPLDLAIAPNGNVLVSSEFPFGAKDAATSVREYDGSTGKLVRVFQVDGAVPFLKPRGLRFGPDGNLYCVSEHSVVAFDFGTGRFLAPIVLLENLNGQALEFLPTSPAS